MSSSSSGAVEAVTARGETLVAERSSGMLRARQKPSHWAGLETAMPTAPSLQGRMPRGWNDSAWRLPERRFRDALVGREDDRPLVERRHRIHGGDIDELAVAGLLGGAKGRHGADGRGEAVRVGAPGTTALEGLAVGVASDGGIAAHRPVDERGGAAGGVGAGKAEGPAGDGDKARVQAAGSARPEWPRPPPGPSPGVDIDLVDDDVGGRDQGARQVSIPQDRRALVHPQVLEERRASLGEEGVGGTRRRASAPSGSQRDDIGARACKEASAPGGGDASSQFDDGDAFGQRCDSRGVRGARGPWARGFGAASPGRRR